MRLFTAIDISAEVKERLRTLVHRLRPLADVKWSPVDNLHVTTKFIGEWPEGRLEEMKRILSGVGAADAINVSIHGLGWFPSVRRPHTFWAGVDGGEALKALAKTTGQSVAKAGVPLEDREYSPHLTLARLKDRVPLDGLRRAIAGLDSDNFGSFRVYSFFLYLSAGGKYTKLAEFKLT